MGVSILLLVGGLLLAITGVVLLVIRKKRNIAVLCLIVGLALILVPPIFVMVNTM